MPIDTQCEHCGFAYVSKDEMAGKKVRCRNCGQIFTIRSPRATDDPSSGSAVGLPDLAGAEDPFADLPQEQAGPSAYNSSTDETRQMPAITKYESNMSGGVGSAKSRMERGEVEAFDFTAPQPGDLSRPSVPFTFPYAGDLDEWLPRIVPAIMVAWVLYVFWGWRPDPDTADTYPAWGGLIPVGLLLFAFLVLWTPLYAGAMRKVAKAMNFSLPTRSAIRAMCLASVPFALGGIFWLAGESLITAAIGLFIGAAIVVPGAWFLYRLRESEIVHAAIAFAFATIISAGLTAGLLWGGSFLLNKAMDSTGNAKMFAQSPVGPDLPWEITTTSASTPTTQTTSRPPVVPPVSPDTGVRPPIAPPPEPEPRIAEADRQPPADTAQPTGIPMPPRPAPGTREQPPAPSAVAERDPFEKHPIFENGVYLPIERPILDIIYPRTHSNFMAVVSPTQDPRTHEVVLYTLNPFAVKARETFSSTVLNSGYALSPDGQLLVRVTHFADSAALQVYDFKQGRVVANNPLGAIGSEPRLLGFIDDKSVLCEWRNVPGNAPYELGALDLTNLTSMQFTAWAISDDRHSEAVEVMPDFKRVALVGASNDGTVTLRFWQPSRRDDDKNRATRIFLMQQRGAFALSPTGIAARPDGMRVAVTYEESGQLQLLVCKVGATLEERRGPIYNHIFPGGLGLRATPRDRAASNRLIWLPGGNVVVYGQLCINAESGERLGTMDVGPVIAQQLVSNNSMHFLVSTPQGPRVLQASIKPSTTQPTAGR